MEKTIIKARATAEFGARNALEALAIHHHEPYGHMNGEQRKLRNRLRAHGRYLGDRLNTRSGDHAIDNLTHECAYEHWHGMLFARFLAENHLLIEPETGIAIAFDECEELANEEGIDKWELATRFAHRMLPQVFRPDHPVFEVRFAREYRLKLEDLVEELSAEIFTATNSLGWVYQFWQTKRKKEINHSEVKIGADELPAVTQIFTEFYMVQFLLHNSLGAWWVSRHPQKSCPVNLTFLRRTEDVSPAAGRLEGWPDDLSEFRLLDPCCGSGHFLVASLLMLVPMRMKLEGLTPTEAIDAVLRENIHGLELDQRCIAIAAFALALEAWRYPDTGGFRMLPKLNLAWCGQPITGGKNQWLALAEGNSRLEKGMEVLYDTFRDAPTLGSLIAPSQSLSKDLFTAGFDELRPLLEKALREYAGEEEREEATIAALGITEATRILSGSYHLVITNVPYLARGKQNRRLREFAEKRYPSAKSDLANVFLRRCLDFTKNGEAGVTQIVMPQNWLSLVSYRSQREHLLKDVRWELLVWLGERAFESVQATGASPILLMLTHVNVHPEHQMHCIDASKSPTAAEKAEFLEVGKLIPVRQQEQLENPEARVMAEISAGELLNRHTSAFTGIQTGDYACFGRKFWEFPYRHSDWRFQQSTVSTTINYGGREHVVHWGEEGELYLQFREKVRIQGGDLE